ncbi:hypothetical protein HJG53_00875 [Sphingomonas sp. ID1715]|uniref:SPOR domain-containing protein n=1 Tax=Sphingomonas sp. ID1715 TaxID=1656898 RepID=UPI001488DC0C|nr:SPOR domain-containing protein [Sphingomonas sp. ID1715]NNM75462.1 hypothetical protein [Sphingomonas sp. ID1715]
MALKIALASLLAMAAAMGQPTLEELKRAAISGDREAAFALGRAYKLGDEAPLDTREAARWLEKAAQLGHPKAGGELGLVLFQDGKGRDALPWLKAAAQAGDARAQYALGTIYFAGEIAPPDPAQAKALMTRAARSGLPAAREALAIMATPAVVPVQPAPRVTVQAPQIAPAKPLSEWEVQLGAFAVPGNARRLWQELRPRLAGSFQPSFRTDRAITRLRLAGFPSRAAAERFCANQRRQKRDCLEVRTKS